MGIVLTEDFLISDSNESQSIRSYIKDKARILKITALPQNAFYNTTQLF
jgi:type I restriction-modification system DNA methylase subunit